MGLSESDGFAVSLLGAVASFAVMRVTAEPTESFGRTVFREVASLAVGLGVVLVVTFPSIMDRVAERETNRSARPFVPSFVNPGGKR